MFFSGLDDVQAGAEEERTGGGAPGTLRFWRRAFVAARPLVGNADAARTFENLLNILQARGGLAGPFSRNARTLLAVFAESNSR